MAVATNNFPMLCRQWRRLRHLSQLDLAESAEISQRHLSWLETGRSQPSRSMVLRLAEAMEVPLRERNTLLNSAGFAAQYRESGLDEPHMKPVRQALEQVLLHHQPFPAIVVDRQWNLVLGNTASEQLLALSGVTPEGVTGTTSETTHVSFNLAEATLNPTGLRRFISNADEALPLFVQRLRSEALSSGEPAVIAHVESLIRAAGDLPPSSPRQEALLPVLPLEFNIDGLELSLFSVISTFGTPQDVTTDELRIEAFYPSDEATREFFESVAKA